MDISVELSLLPLSDNYRNEIIKIIKNLRASGLHIIETPLSTQIYGTYDEVMKVLNNELKEAFESSEKVMAFMKIVKSDRRNYKPTF